MKDVPILVALAKLTKLEEAATALELDLTNVPARLAQLEREITAQRNGARSAFSKADRKSAEHKLAETEAEYQRLTDVNKLYWPRPSVLPQRQIASHCRAWLTELPHDCHLELCPSPPPSDSDEPITLDGIRNRIKVLQEQIWAITHASPPPDRPARKREARQFVERLGAIAKSHLASDGQTLSLFGNPVWPISSNVGGTGGLHPNRFLPFLAAIVPDHFTAMLERAVDALPIDPNYIPEPERSERLTALNKQILQLERIEEGLCEATGEARRADASPEAVLGLRLIAPEVGVSQAA